MADLLRIKQNIQTMADKGATSEEIDEYARLENVTPNMLRNIPLTNLVSNISQGVQKAREFTFPVKGDVIPQNPLLINPVLQGLLTQENAQKYMQERPGAPYGFNLMAGPVLRTARDLGLTRPTTMAGYEAGGALINPMLQRVATTPFGRQIIQKQLPNLGKNLLQETSNIPLKPINTAVEYIKNIPNQFFRGGLTKPEAIRIESEYGSSTGALVDVVKNKLNQAISYADNMYGKVFQKIPENKFIDIKPAIEQAGYRLKRLGLITDTGNLTELGQSEIARDSVYGKLLDFFQSSKAISGVEKLQGKALTGNQMAKAMSAERQTLVNKEQFLFLRDKLNSLYKGKPSDIDVSKVVDSFYQSGENSGLNGLQAARKLEREAFLKADKFLDNKGDLRIANEVKLSRIGTDKPLSQQEMKHILELQGYVKHPIITDATKINKLNQAKATIKRAKQWGKGAAAGAVIGEVGRKTITGRW